MNISSLSLVSTVSPPGRFSDTSARAILMNWPSQPVAPSRRSPALITGGSASSSGLIRMRVAGEISADELGRATAAAGIVDMERHLAGEGDVEQIGRGWIRARGGAARHDVRIGPGEDDDLTGFERDRLASDDAGKAGTSRHHMIGNQMVGTGED